VVKEICVCGQDKEAHNMKGNIGKYVELHVADLLTREQIYDMFINTVYCCDNYKQDNLKYLEQLAEQKEV